MNRFIYFCMKIRDWRGATAGEDACLSFTHTFERRWKQME